MIARGDLVLPVPLLACSMLVLSHSGSEPWEKFLEEPSEETLMHLERTLTPYGEKRCDPSVTPSEEQSNRLFELIRAGNELAFGAAILVSHCWSGAFSEDYFQSAGAFFERQPHGFLQIVTDRSVKASELDDLLTSLPLETVDDIDLRISTIQKRIDILQSVSVSGRSMEDMRLKGLAFLEKELSFLREHRD